jgi:hypothetical protein
MAYYSIPRNGLVGEWLLDSNSNDTNDGTKNNGTATNVTYENSPVGYQKQRGVFNGSSSYVRTTTNPIGAAFSSVFSVSARFKFSSELSSDGSRDIVMTQNSSAPYSSFVLRYNRSSGVNRLYAIFGTDTYRSASYAVNLGTSEHCAEAVHDGSTMYLYLDGVLVASDSTTPTQGSATSGVNGLNIGCYYGLGALGANFCPGSIASVRVYNRVLTATERLHLWHEFNRKLGGGSDFGAYIPAPKYGGIGPDKESCASLTPTVLDAPSDTTDMFGISGNAKSFDGTNDGYAYTIGVSLSSGQSMTAMVMVYGDTAPTKRTWTGGSGDDVSDYASPLCSGPADAAGPWSFAWNNPDSTANVGTVSMWNGSTTYVAKFGTVGAQEWACITMKFDQANNKLRAYLNGVFQNETATTGNIAASSNIRFSVPNFGYFPGKVGQWAVWDTALTDDQIKFASSAMRSGRYPYAFRRSVPPHLVAKAKFYAPNGYTNVAQSGYNLAITGSPTYPKAYQNSLVSTSSTGNYARNTSAIPSCAIAAGNSYTLACWINSSDTTGVEYYLWAADNTGPLGLAILLLSGTVQVDWTRVNIADDITNTGLVPDGKWHHVAATFSGGVTKAYVDGHLQATGSYTNSNGTGSAGGPGNGTAFLYGFDAQVTGSDPFITNSALSAEEIQHLYLSTYRN